MFFVCLVCLSSKLKSTKTDRVFKLKYYTLAYSPGGSLIKFNYNKK